MRGSAPTVDDTDMPDMGSLDLGADTRMEGSVAPNIEEPHAAPESQASVIETDPSIGQAGAEGNVAQASAVTESTQAVPAKQQDLSQLRQQNPKSPKQQVTQSTASVQPPLSKASSDAAPRQAAKIQQKLKLVPRQTPHKTALSDTTKGASGSRGQTNTPKASKRGKASASTLTIAPRASAKPGTAAAPSPDTQVELYAGTGAQRAAFLVPSEEDDFIPGRTESGSSYGSLQPYVDSWNAGDLAEVSSNPKPHPAGPSVLAQRVYEAGVIVKRLNQAVQAVDETAKKNINSRTTVYKQLLDDHRRASNTLKVAQQELSFTKAESKKHLEKVLKELADANAEKDKLAGQLKQEQEEVASLKNQLAETSESHKAELERAASEKTRLENEKLKIQGVADEAEKKSAAAEEAARQFQVRIDAWTAEFKKVQDNMHANFPESTPRVATAVANFRQERGEPVPIDMKDWRVEDHLIAFSHRIKPLNTAVCKLMNAGMHAYQVLWPDTATPKSPLSLPAALQEAGVRLSAWRFSAGRAAADEVLVHLLSWYETVDLDLIQSW